MVVILAASSFNCGVDLISVLLERKIRLLLNTGKGAAASKMDHQRNRLSFIEVIEVKVDGDKSRRLRPLPLSWPVFSLSAASPRAVQPACRPR